MISSTPVVRLMFLHFLMLRLTAVTEQDLTTDQAALLQLKAHIKLDPRNLLASNWSTSVSPCNWVGVTCGARHRRVTALNLQNLSLGGTIPPHVGNLSFLVNLEMRGNNFQGHLPKELWQLRRLKVIDLSYNSLSGSLPGYICKTRLTQLRWLNINSNDISGQLPSSLGDCSKLEVLFLRNNKFRGQIPQSIGNLTQLKLLFLDDNNFQGEMPSEIGNLRNLKCLFIGFNALTGLIPSMLFNFSNINIIDLSQNQFTGKLSSSIGLYVPNLRELSLARNLLRGIIPASICNASKLMFMQLSWNSFSGLVPNTLGNCKQLERLSLHHNHLTTTSTLGWSFLSSLTNCRYLKVLALNNNPLKGMLPTSLGNLSTSLEYFNAGDCGVSGGIPVEIGNLKNMIFLSLNGNNLTGSIPKTVGKLQKLQGLYLSNNKLQGSIPSDICQLESLDELVLESNEFQGAIPTCVVNLNSLRHLYLGSNKLNSSIPSTFWSLRFILAVDLSSNLLSGSLPLDIGNLEVLYKLNLSKNQLSGDIPSSIGNLKALTSLSFARNGFQGLIPQSFGRLISLETLDLSGNNLSGVIPKSLEALSHLKYFNVSFNRLEGEIPTGGPFINFSTESFVSNHGLCGSPHLKIPPCKTSSIQRSKQSSTLRYILPAVVSLIIIVSLIFIFIRCYMTDRSKPTQDNLLNLATWKRISNHELQQLTNGFCESNLLGRGSSGSVYQATLSDGMTVAIKVFNLELGGALKSFDTECEVMRQIRHRNLVKIISTCSDNDFKALILQYMPKGSLEKWLYSHNFFLDILQRLNILIDVASALEYLHHGYSIPVIHCDLKPNNVLLDDDMVAHVSDFGIAKLLDGVDSVKHTMTFGTVGYIAPEYGLEGRVSVSGDIYSFGILLMETFTRRKPIDEMFRGEMSLKCWVEQSLPNAVTTVLDANLLRGEEDHFEAKKNCMSLVMDLALKCSADIPEERMNMKDVIVTLESIKTKFLNDLEEARYESSYLLSGDTFARSDLRQN